MLLVFSFGSVPSAMPLEAEAGASSFGEQGPEFVVLNPSTGDVEFKFSADGTGVGTRFNATVWVCNVSDLFAFQVDMEVDDDLLGITGAWNPTWDSDWVFYGEPSFSPKPAFSDDDVDGVNETVMLAATLFYPATVSVDDGLLAVVELEILYAPDVGKVSCPLDIESDYTYLLDIGLNDIISIRTGGYYEIDSGQMLTYLVVRGMDNRIYYRMYNLSDGVWGSWGVLPGATCDSPAVAVVSERLYVVVRGMDGASLWFGWLNLLDHSFSGWTALSGGTPSAPTLVSNGSTLCLVVRGFNDQIYYRSYGGSWQNWASVPGMTCDGPAAAMISNELHLVVRGFDGDTLWHGYLSNLADPSSFAGWTLLPGATPSPPTLAREGDRIALVVRGFNNRIYYRVYERLLTFWEDWSVLSSGSTSGGPAATVSEGRLDVIVQGEAGDSLWHSPIDIFTSSDPSWGQVEGATPSKPALTDL